MKHTNSLKHALKISEAKTGLYEQDWAPNLY